MDRRIDAGIDFQDLAVLVDYIGDSAVEAEDRNSVGGVVGGRDLVVGIEQQREGKIVLLDKRLVRIGAINAASEHRDPGLLIAGESVAEGTRLLGASGCVVFGIEILHQFLAGEIAEPDRLDLLAEHHLAVERGRRVAFFEHLRPRHEGSKNDRRAD